VGEIGIDLGTATTVVCHPRDGVVHDEASLLVEWPVRRGRELILGNAAAALDGRTPPGARVGHPLRGGAVTDLTLVRTFREPSLVGGARRGGIAAGGGGRIARTPP
jgi:rod shape-determining protein MreB and related proteins